MSEWIWVLTSGYEVWPGAINNLGQIAGGM